MKTRPPQETFEHVQANLDCFPKWLIEKIDESEGDTINQAWFALGGCFVAWALQDRTTIERFITNCDTVVELFMKGHAEHDEAAVDKLVRFTNEVVS